MYIAIILKQKNVLYVILYGERDTVYCLNIAT